MTNSMTAITTVTALSEKAMTRERRSNLPTAMPRNIKRKIVHMCF